VHAPVSAEQLKALQLDEPVHLGDIKDPQLWKILPVVLVFLGAVAASIAIFGSAAITVLGLGGTAFMFATVIYLTRG
jgi:hypothetical protein